MKMESSHSKLKAIQKRIEKRVEKRGADALGTDIFEPKELTALPTPKHAKKMSTRERTKGEAELLQLEWAMKYSNQSVTGYLRDIKGYSHEQAVSILAVSPKSEWQAKKNSIRDHVTSDLIKRHVDLMAEVQETHIRASNLGMAKAVEMMSKMQLSAARDKSGKLLIDERTGKPLYRGFRSIDLLNSLQSIKIAQEIYRRAMGLPNDGDGLAQVLEKLQVTNNTQINIGVESKEAQQLSKLSYDEIMTFVNHKRAKLKAIEQAKVAEEETANDI